jgi:tetratricopeptide (TPR) repeat protein
MRRFTGDTGLRARSVRAEAPATTPALGPVLASTAMLAVIVVMALLTVCASARTPEDQSAAESRIQEARRAAAVGSVEEAIEIYRDVLREDPGNERAFWGLVGLYSSAGMEERLIPLLEARVSDRPHDTQAKMELGEAYARAGEHDAAHRLWMEVVAEGAADASEFAEVGALEIRHGMYDQALQTFLKGRDTFRSESLFSQELTQVYTALGDYDSAIDECFVTVRQHGGAAPWAANRIELMLEEGADRGDIRSRMTAVSRDVNATADDLALAASVFLVLDMPDRALETFLRADEVSPTQGNDLLEYAAVLSDDGRKEQAREAYLKVIERYPGTSGAARAGEAAARLLADAGDAEGAVAELRAVAGMAAGSTRGAHALFEAARIELDVLKDPEAALATVAELRESFGIRASELDDEATMIEVDAQMRLGRFGAAYARAATLIRDGVADETLESAMFALGFLSFLQHDYERATEELRKMVEANAAGVLVNDALRLMLAMAEAQEAGDTGPIDLLADAHAARLSGDREGSSELLQRLANGPTNEAVETEALLLLGASAAADGDPERAVEYYDRIITGTEGITARAEAMMRKADLLWRAMGRKQEASDAYLAILEDLPANVLSGEARRKLDMLRRGEEAG